MKKKKRYQAQSQGDIRAIWNVIDLQTSTYAKFAIAGDGAKGKAFALARQLNKENTLLNRTLLKWREIWQILKS